MKRNVGLPDLKSLKRNIRIDCGKYLVRTMKPDDASDRLSSWLSDSGAMDTLNLRAKRLSKPKLDAYIKGFDQWSRWLLGVFEKQSGLQIGIIRTDIDYAASRCHVNMLIGEAEYRNKGLRRTSSFRAWIMSSKQSACPR